MNYVEKQDNCYIYFDIFFLLERTVKFLMITATHRLSIIEARFKLSYNIYERYVYLYVHIICIYKYLYIHIFVKYCIIHKIPNILPNLTLNFYP